MRKTREPKSRIPRLEAYALTSLHQVKVVADPLRIRILGALRQERTTKQVAELLGEKPTRLYHHMDALEKVGLVELSRTRQNRGTLEKYYLAVARTFHTDGGLFQATGAKGGGERTEALRRMVSTIFDTTSAELNRIVEQGNGSRIIKDEGIVGFLEIRGSKKELSEIREKLNNLVQSVAATTEKASDNDKRYRLTLAYYALESDPAPKS